MGLDNEVADRLPLIMIGHCLALFGQLNLLPDYPACLKTVALAFLVLGSSLYLVLSA